MTVGKVSVNVEQITKNLNDAKALMEQQKKDVQSLFDNVTSVFLSPLSSIVAINLGFIYIFPECINLTFCQA